jgi:hypothetical protein
LGPLTFVALLIATPLLAAVEVWYRRRLLRELRT